MIRQTGAILASRGLKQLIASSYGQLACHEASALCGAFGSFRSYADAPQNYDPLVPQSRQVVPGPVPRSNQGPWEPVTDGKTGQTYYWQKETGLTTPLGAPKPDAWVEVIDSKTGGVYYWNEESGDTTAVGEPMPGPEGRLQTQQSPYQPQTVPATGYNLLVYPLFMGAGVGLAFGIFRAFF
eukprot:jgi/Chrzof1/4135/Cz14g00130.t1